MESNSCRIRRTGNMDTVGVLVDLLFWRSKNEKMPGERALIIDEQRFKKTSFYSFISTCINPSKNLPSLPQPFGFAQGYNRK